MISPCTASALGRRLLIRDRYPFSPRARTLRANLAKLRPERVREPLPPRKVLRHCEQQPLEGTALGR